MWSDRDVGQGVVRMQMWGGWDMGHGGEGKWGKE